MRVILALTATLAVAGLDAGAQTPSPAPTVAGPGLSIAERLPAVAGGSVAVPVVFTSNGGSIATTLFSVDFDEACLSFDPTDADQDGIPDAVTILAPAVFVASVAYDGADTGGELDLFVGDLSPPLGSLPDGPLAQLSFGVACQPSGGTPILASVGFSSEPGASFGDTAGRSVAGTATGGSVEIRAPTATPGPTAPRLSIPIEAPAVAGSLVSLPVSFAGNGSSIASAVFSVDFEETCLGFDPTDADGDTIPDAVLLSLPPGLNASVSYDSLDFDGELDFLIADFSAPLAQLPDGPLATISMTALCEPGLGNTVVAPVRFSFNPPGSFGGTDGTSVSGTTSGGSVRIASAITPSPSPSATDTSTRTATRSPTPSGTPARSATPGSSPAITGTAAPAGSATRTATASSTHTPTGTSATTPTSTPPPVGVRSEGTPVLSSLAVLLLLLVHGSRHPAPSAARSSSTSAAATPGAAGSSAAS